MCEESLDEALRDASTRDGAYHVPWNTDQRCVPICPVRVCLSCDCAMVMCSLLRREHPAACLLALAYQQVWPVNAYASSIDSSRVLPMRN